MTLRYSHTEITNDSWKFNYFFILLLDLGVKESKYGLQQVIEEDLQKQKVTRKKDEEQRVITVYSRNHVFSISSRVPRWPKLLQLLLQSIKKSVSYNSIAINNVFNFNP